MENAYNDSQAAIICYPPEIILMNLRDHINLCESLEFQFYLTWWISEAILHTATIYVIPQIWAVKSEPVLISLQTDLHTNTGFCYNQVLLWFIQNEICVGVCYFIKKEGYFFTWSYITCEILKHVQSTAFCDIFVICSLVSLFIVKRKLRSRKDQSKRP